MIIRPATFDDLSAVLSIIDDGKAALAALGLDQWQGGNPSRERVEADIEAGYTRVAVDEETGAILGTTAFCDCGEPDYDNVVDGAWLTESPNGVGEDAGEDAGKGAAEGAGDCQNPVRYIALHRVAVAANARRRGVASFLVTSGIEEARSRGFASVRVDTHERNIPMQSTFTKCGMTRCCEIRLTNPLESNKKRIGFEIVL